MKKKTKLVILDFLLAVVFFGGLGWIMEQVTGRTHDSVAHFLVRGLIFAVIVVPLNFWLKEKGGGEAGKGMNERDNFVRSKSTKKQLIGISETDLL